MSDVVSEDKLIEVRQQIELQRRKHEKMKFKHGHSTDLLFELRSSFQGSLNKLNNLDTRDVAVRELRQIIDRNVTSEALKIFINSLGDLKKVKSPGAREQEVQLVGFIAQVFGEKVLDDGGKSLQRLLEIAQGFFADLSRSVHEAAASSYCEVYFHCMRKDRVEEILGIFFDPLEIGLTSGVNVKSQQAASLAIFKWFQVLVQEENTAVLQSVSHRVVNLYVRLRTDFADLISAVGVIVEYSGLAVVLQDVHPILKKTIQYLSVSGTGTHLYKIEACKLLSCLARHLQGMADVVIDPYHSEVLYVLQQVKIDKLQSVQNAARNALNDWKTLESLQQEIEEKKMQEVTVNDDVIVKYAGKNNKELRDSSPAGVGPNNFKAIRELAKRNKKNSDWGLSRPRFLEKKSGNYSNSPNNSREFLRNSKEVSFYPNLMVSKEGVNKDVMEIIHKKSQEARAKNEVLVERETPEPRREVYIKHISKPEKLDDFSVKIQETFKMMEKTMDQGFSSIEKRLKGLDGRMDSAYERLQNLSPRLSNKSSMPSFIHPPKADINCAFTQTQNNVEIQAALSQTSGPQSLNSPKNLDSLSLAWVEVLQSVNNGDLDSAYRKVLSTGDDIYLLRLMHKTGVCLKSLSQDLAKNLMQRLGMILSSNFLEILGMTWINEAVREKVFDRLKAEEKDTIFEVLQRYANLPGDEGDFAEEILRSISY
jgi:hypothetical protein